MLLPRSVAVDRVREKYPGADDAKECGDCFQHENDPSVQRHDLTARLATQSKGFRKASSFRSVMMILCNSFRALGRRGARPREAAHTIDRSILPWSRPSDAPWRDVHASSPNAFCPLGAAPIPAGMDRASSRDRDRSEIPTWHTVLAHRDASNARRPGRGADRPIEA